MNCAISFLQRPSHSCKLPIICVGLGANLLMKGIVAVLFQLKGPGLHDNEHTFEKPWFTTWESALSCWVSLIIFWIIKLAAKLASRARRTNADQQQPLLSPTDQITEVSGEFDSEWAESFRQQDQSLPCHNCQGGSSSIDLSPINIWASICLTHLPQNLS